MTREDATVQSRCGRHAAELLHPKIRSWHARCRPRRTRSEQHVYVPCRTRRLEKLPVRDPNVFARIPIVRRAHIRHEPRRVRNVVLMRAELGNPHDVRLNSLVAVLEKQPSRLHLLREDRRLRWG